MDSLITYCRRIVCVVFLSLYVYPANAQSMKNELDKMLPPTPQVSSFLRIGEFPVSYYTGTPNISIPLYSMKVHGIDLSQSLNYDGTAIPVNSLPTWVGQGWSLLPGGVITKVTIGSAMDLSDSTLYTQLLQGKNYNQSMILQFLQYDATSATIGYWNQSDPFVPGYPPSENWNVNAISDVMFRAFVGGQYFQPDIYIFNFLGHSGKFYIDPLSHKVIFLKNPDNVKITYTGYYGYGANTIWTATCTDGSKATFGAFERIQPVVSAGEINESYTWKLSSVQLLNNDVYNYTYKDVSYNVYDYTTYATMNFLSDGDLSSAKNSAQPPVNNAWGEDYMYNVYYEKYLQMIDGPDCKIRFNLTDEIKPKLADITVVNNSDPTLTHKFSFEYAEYKCSEGSFNSKVKNQPYYSGDAVYSRYKLTRLTESYIKNGVETQNEPYRFDYIDNLGLPSVLSRGMDYWGYANGATNYIPVPDETRIFSSVSWTNDYIIPSSDLEEIQAHCNAQRWVDTSYLEQGMLKRVTYPTKGSIVLNYEPHMFNYPGAHILSKQEYESFYKGSNDSVSVGAGLRIKEMLTYNENNRFASRKKYLYGNNAKLFLPLRFWKIDNNGYYSYTAELVGILNLYHSFTGCGSNLNNSPLIPHTIGYDQVDVQESSTEKDADGEINNGLASYHFFNSALQFNYPFNFPYLTTLDARNGSMDYESYYDEQGRIVKMIKYHYALLSSNEYVAIKGRQIMDLNYSFAPGKYIPRTGIYALTYFPMPTQVWMKDTTTEIVYEKGVSPFTTQTAMQYTSDTFHLLYQRQVRKSMGNAFTSTIYTYPNNYKDIDGFIGDMKANYLIDKPIETVSANIGQDGTKIISGRITTYGRGALSAQPLDIYNLESNTAIPISNFRFSNISTAGSLPNADLMGNFYLNTTLYKPITHFTGYDTRQDLTDYYNEGDKNIAVIWDYLKQFPIATIAGGSTAQTAFTSFESDGTGGWTIPTSTRDTINVFTGKQSYPLNGTISKSGLPAGSDYIVSYWSANGALTVNGTNGFSKNEANSWTYYEHVITGNPTTISVTGAATIDELRLYPKGAIMRSFTYSPVFGRTSECGANGVPFYFEFDGLGRLNAIRDFNGNIIKAYQYHTHQ